MHRDGRRPKAIDGTVTERYLWADTTRLLATYDGEGVLTRRFLYADARTPYAMETPAGRRYLAYDQVGSPRAVTDTSGAVMGTMSCDSFGNVVSASGEATGVGLGFAGGLTDADTGLVLFGARDYDASQGRWMAKDPIGFEGGDVDLYGYCLGDPVGLVDPAGLDTIGVNATLQGGFLGSAAAGAASVGYAMNAKDALAQLGHLEDQGVQVPVLVSGNATLAGTDVVNPGGEVHRTGGVLPFGFGGSLQGQYTTADSPCDLRGFSTRYGFDIGGVSGDFIQGDGYWGIEWGVGTKARVPSVHVFDEYTSIRTPDVLGSLGVR